MKTQHAESVRDNVYSPYAIPVHVTMYSSQVLLKRETPMEIMVEVQWKGICRNKENGVQ